MTTSTPTTSINATCACNSFSLQIHFPSSSLPITRALCLCNGCRAISGSCGTSYIAVPKSQSIHPAKFAPPLTAYKSSPDLTRYFCSRCGAHVLCYRISEQTWRVATGLWDLTEGVTKWTGTKYVEDTLDGGISPWLTSIIDRDSGTARKLENWTRGDEKDAQDVPEDFGTIFVSKTAKSGVVDGGKERLKAQCHCGAVKFYITRPNEDSKRAQRHFPDLMVPYYTGASSANPENVPWWLRSNDTKYLAGTCTCRSCRVASGFEIQPWAFIPKCNIIQPDGAPMDYGMGGLRRYESSKEVYREFCAVCGASVFWHIKERPELVDVSVGLLDPGEGARVERWLDWWTERVSFEEMAVSRSLVEALQAGLSSWGEREREV